MLYLFLNLVLQNVIDKINPMSVVLKFYPLIHMKKFEVWNMMPQDLRQLTWSCRTPIYEFGEIKQCNSCKTCIELKENGINK